MELILNIVGSMVKYTVKYIITISMCDVDSMYRL